jgi:DNA-directed RNA polymerase subunit omega
MLPSPDTLNDFQPGKFVLSNLAAKRAKQLREGAQPLVQIESSHPLTIALAEIAAGKIRAILPSATDPIPSNVDDIPMLIDDTLPAELGMLLPALDETEAALVTTALDDEAEADHGDDEVVSLSDLVAEDEEVATPSEEDTLSLSDIADQETSLEDDEETEE